MLIVFIKECIKRHHKEKETLKGSSSVEEPKQLFFLGLNLFMFCFELIFFFFLVTSTVKNFPESI